MNKEKKKKIKRIASVACIGVIVLTLALMPLIAEKKKQSEQEASILSGTIETGSVNTEVIGGGTIAEQDAISVTVPTEVMLKEYLVSNGDSVKEGDALATVDRVTVMSAITKVQETMDYLSEEIEKASEEETESEVVALAGGTVKILYAKENASVQDIMLEHGALAVLSLDGLMAVDLEVESELEVGTAVKVTFENGSTVSGNIEQNLLGNLTITLKDKSYEVGSKVQVAAEDGTALGSGELYIYSPWNATAYAGTIDSIKVKEGKTVDEGDVLMKLTDAGESATYKQLVSQRQAYEDLMMDLFEMYQTETIAAPCDGVVSGVDKNSVQLLAAGNQSYKVELLANAPNGDDETLYLNYVGVVTAVGQNGWALSVNPQNIEIADYKNLSEVSLDKSTMTELKVLNPTAPIYELQGDAWVQLEAASITAGDILLFAGDTEGNFVWMVRIQKAASEPTEPETPDEPSTPSEPSEPSDPGNSGTPSDPSNPGNSGTPSNPSMPSGSGSQTMPNMQVGSFSDMSGFPQGNMMEQEDVFELYDMEVVDVISVTPQESVKLDINVNELDIASIQVGMTAEVKINALGGEKFTATITDISNTGSNNGGYSYFTVELTMDRGEDVLVGMNATATMVTATAENILTVPVDALVEEGTQTIVYTDYDEANNKLLNPVVVTIGASDGQVAEVIEGLSEGATYYYAYYDTVEISFTPDFGGGMGGFSFGR